MATDWMTAVPDPARLRRFVVRCCTPGLVLALASAIPLKAAGLLPPTVSWAGVVLVPTAWFATIAMTATLPAFFPERRRIMLLVCAGCMALTLILVAWQGWV